MVKDHPPHYRECLGTYVNTTKVSRRIQAGRLWVGTPFPQGIYSQVALVDSMVIPTHAAQSRHSASGLLKSRMREAAVPFLPLRATQLPSSRHLFPSSGPQRTLCQLFSFNITLVHLALETLESVCRNISPATLVDKVILPRANSGNMQETRKCVSSTALLWWHEGESQRPLLSDKFLQTPSRYLAG